MKEGLLFARDVSLVDSLCFQLASIHSASSFSSIDQLFLCAQSDASICFPVTFSPLGNSDYIVFSVSIDFPLNWKGNAPF